MRWGRATGSLLASVALMAAASAGAGAHEAGALRCAFTDPAITESSGVVVGSLPDGYLFTHNDSGGGSVFFAVGPACDTVTRYQLAFGPWRSIDWEDMAAAPGVGGAPSLFLGDVGDNSRVRPVVTVYEVAEPDPLRDPATVDVAVRAIHHLAYPDGPHDAEALVVDPATGALAVITKETDGRSGVYLATVAADGPGVGLSVERGDTEASAETPPVLVSTLARVGTIDLDPIARPHDPGVDFSPASRLLVTGADVAPDGSRLVVRTYVEAFEWALGPAGLAGGLVGPPHRIPLPPTAQGEAIGYHRDGRSLVATSEGAGAPVHDIAP